jgi:hypothetical protein
MRAETLTQDEIDILISSNLKDIDTVITTKLSGSSTVTPEMISTAKTMLNRYYYTLTHCGFEEQRIARDNLRQAAFRIWLHRYGFATKSGYIKFINREAAKKGLHWRFCTSDLDAPENTVKT